MNEPWDLAIVGAGRGALTAAIRGGQLGLRTVLVSARGEAALGHDGALALATLREVVDLWLADRQGLRGDPKPVAARDDWQLLQYRAQAISDTARATNLAQLARAGVAVRHGTGRLDGPGRLQVTTPDRAEEAMAARNILLVTGGRPEPPAGLEAEGERLVFPSQVRALAELPNTCLVSGGGPVGAIVAGILADLGCAVTLVEMRERLLPGLPEEVAEPLAAALVQRGVRLLTSHRLIASAAASGGVTASLLDTAARTEMTLTVERVVLATGRRPDSRALGLDTVTVETDRRGHVLVDGACQTGEPGLFAVGDLVPTPGYASVAAPEALAAVSCAAGQTREPIRYRKLPVWFASRPAVATVGLSTEQARAEGYEVRVGRVIVVGLATGAGSDGAAPVATAVFDAQTGDVLGVHAVGPQATTLVVGAAAGLALQEV